jgi:outer membrane protein assembly factor BamB
MLGIWCAAVWLAAGPAPAGDADWPRFRGVNGAGRCLSELPLPDEIGPDVNVVWKTPLDAGHSSPVVYGHHIYLTAEREGKLFTMAIDRDSGTVLWEVEAPHDGLEPIHQIGSHAQCSPVTDGERVVVLFGSCGLYCYDCHGRFLWKCPMGPFNNDFGASSSPILAGDLVILAQDHDTDSFLMAVDKRTGETVWRTDRSEFPRNSCTPVVWESAGAAQIVVAATLRVAGYDLASGAEIWTVRGLSRAVCSSPAVSEDGMLYVAGWAAGADEGERIVLAPFEEAIAADGNGNGALELDELPDGPVKMRFSQIDRDKSGSITREEYGYYRGLFDQAHNKLVAIRPGPRGEATDTHVQWEFARGVPFCASPVVYRGLVFAVKDGGILTCLDAATGALARQGRIAAGNYYSSPVAGDGKIYFASQTGDVTVVSAQRDWQVVAEAAFDENIYATPALVEGRIYLRTAGHLYCCRASH